MAAPPRASHQCSRRAACVLLRGDLGCWIALKKRQLICRGGGPRALLHTHSCSHLHIAAQPLSLCGPEWTHAFLRATADERSSGQRGRWCLRHPRFLLLMNVNEWFTHATTSTRLNDVEKQKTQGWRDLTLYKWDHCGKILHKKNLLEKSWDIPRIHFVCFVLGSNEIWTLRLLSQKVHRREGWEAHLLCSRPRTHCVGGFMRKQGWLFTGELLFSFRGTTSKCELKAW